MEFKVKHIAYTVGGLGAAYLVYTLLNKGFSFVAKYPRLYALVTSGESKTYNDYNFYNVSGLKSNVDGQGSKYPLLNRPLSTYTVGQVKAMQAQARYGANGQLWATGRYQIIPSTLIYLQRFTGISDSALYNKVTQDRLANALIATKPALNNYLTGKVADTTANLQAAALAVAQIWSSVGQPSNNKSYYGENATTSTYDVQKILKSYR
ncbi:MAG: hypothetical protein EBU84_18935 [Actinobacteria bacterium]|nr:hypothetical protein [Actinomycetota bacterium]